jgi:hypothetical protein
LAHLCFPNQSRICNSLSLKIQKFSDPLLAAAAKIDPITAQELIAIAGPH